jgi:hypothetical protein
MISIAIANDDSVDLFVSVTDENTSPPNTLPTFRVNAGQSSAIQVQEDGNGLFRIDTVATDANDSSRSQSVFGRSGSPGDPVSVSL